jgi:hypothetical protein
MKLPFDLPQGRLPVIVPRPKVKPRELIDGTVVHEAHKIRFLNLRSDRGLFDIGSMLNVRQFAKLSAAEQFTILALQRQLTFSDKLEFPNLRDSGKLVYVGNSSSKLVWTTIPEKAIVTSKFTVLDLHDQGMAIDELKALRETIEQSFHGCPKADVEEMLRRFLHFKSPHPTDIRRALKALVRLGIIRKYIKVDRRQSRAVFNMRLVAATRSGILRGMIAAENLLSSVDGTEAKFINDLSAAEPPAKRIKSTSTGKRRKPTKAKYQSEYHSEHQKLIKAKKLITDYESNGYLTSEQFALLRQLQDDPTFTDPHQKELRHVFSTARTDPLTEVPIQSSKTEKKHRG